MELVEFMEKSWALIDSPEKWCKGVYVSTSGGHCSLGAMYEVCGVFDDEFILKQRYDKSLLVLRNDAYHLLILNRPEGFGSDIGLANINDSSDWEQVRDMWLGAIEYAKQISNVQPAVEEERELVAA